MEDVFPIEHGDIPACYVNSPDTSPFLGDIRFWGCIWMHLLVELSLFNRETGMVDGWQNPKHKNDQKRYVDNFQVYKYYILWSVHCTHMQ